LAKAGSFKVGVFEMGTAPEVASFGGQIFDMIKNAGWQADGTTEINGAHNSVLLGLFLGVKDLNSAPPYAITLLNALNSKGVPIQIAADTDIQDPNDVHLIVGGRP
jgi:hypothetical protein